MKKYLLILTMVLLFAMCGCQANIDANTDGQQENNLTNPTETLSRADMVSNISITIRSIDQIDHIKNILNENDEVKLADELLNLEGAGLKTKNDLIHFLEIINNLPTLNLIDGEVSAISYSKGFTEDTEKEYEFAYISIKANDGSWVRFEYLLNENAPAIMDGTISSTEQGITIFSKPIKIAEGKVEIFTEQSKNHSSGVGKLFTWNASIDGINTRIIYYTKNEDQLNTVGVFSSVNVSMINEEELQ